MLHGSRQSSSSSFPQVGKYNILVIGNTGIGKSTLIGQLSQTNLGSSTHKTEKISDSPYQVVGENIYLYDSVGTERDQKQHKNVHKEIENFINDCKQKEPADHIHTIWYCVNSQVTRETDLDKKWIESLAQKMPVIAVITRSSPGINTASLEKMLGKIEGLGDVIKIGELPENPVQLGNSNDLDRLLDLSKKYINDVTNSANKNAVESKGEKTFYKCLLPCATGTLGSLFVPIPIVRVSINSGLRMVMLANIAKEFDFNNVEYSSIQKLLGIAITGTGSLGIIDTQIENILSSVPIDIDSVRNFHDYLSQLVATLGGISGVLPYKDQIIDIINALCDNPLANTPIVNCVFGSVNIFSTIVIGLAFIETMKYFKEREYQGVPQPSDSEIIEHCQQTVHKIVDGLRLWFGGNEASPIT